MRFFVLTDLEGVAGIDSFVQTRTADEMQKKEAMDQLGRETNACIEGIRSVYSDARIDVWDGHGPGGLRASDISDATYLDDGRPYFDLNGYDAMLFVGQHAMAGTVNAPLRHTYSSRTVEYYMLNGSFIGEFGCRALIAGRQGVPTVFLAGDDKAAREAEMFVPEIETVATKRGHGEEAAQHVQQNHARAMVREGAARAVGRLNEIPPFADIGPPYTLTIRHHEPVSDDDGWWRPDADHVSRVDERTVRIRDEAIADPHEEFYLAL